MNEPLIFDIALGRTKPVNMRDASVRCPFCDRSNLTDILAQDGHIIWLMNKYPVLQENEYSRTKVQNFGAAISSYC